MNILPLIVGVTGFASGIACGSFFIVGIAPSIFLGLLALIVFCAWRYTHARFYLFVGIFLMAGGAGIVRIHALPDGPPASFIKLADTPVSLMGVITTDPDIRETTARLTIEVEQGGGKTRILAVAPLYPKHEYGEQVRVSGTLKRPAPFATDGGREFRYDTFLAKDGIYFLVPSARIETLAPPREFFIKVQGALYTGKHMFEDALSRALPEPYASLAEGLIAGGKQGLGKELLAAFTATGLLPIIVLSGYNVMIIAEAVLRGLRFLPKRAALVFAVMVLLAFLFAAGGGSSAARAGIMALIALFARASGRTYDALRALFVAVILMLLFNPQVLLSDPGFQFSVAATLGLILASTLFNMRLTWIRSAFLRDIVASTLAAQLFVLPLLLYQTGNFSFVAIIANILVLPVVPLTMLLAFLAGLISLLIPSAALVGGLPAYVFLWYIVTVAEQLSLVPFAQIIIPMFSFVWVPIMYVGIALMCRALKKTETTPHGVVSTQALPVILKDDEDPKDEPH